MPVRSSIGVYALNLLGLDGINFSLLYQYYKLFS